MPDTTFKHVLPTRPARGLLAIVVVLAGPSRPAGAGDKRIDGLGKKLNILFIMTDQQRFDCLGANGNRIIKTPHLDRLAAASANFQNAFVQAPVCVPSRVTWFTGRYPHCHRNRVNNTPLSQREVLMQQDLREAGYATAAVGKLHLCPPTVAEAGRTGFDRVLLHDGFQPTDAFSDYVKWREAHDPLKEVHYHELARDVPPGRNPFRAAIADEYTNTSWVGLQAREMLNELAGGTRPFFLFVSFFKPHSPHAVPVPFDSMYDDVEIPLPKPVGVEDIRALPLPLRKWIEISQRWSAKVDPLVGAGRPGAPRYAMDRRTLQWVYRTYYASVSQVDREVGRILETLDRTGRARETIVVFASDHGDQLLEHGLLGKNVFFEASIHVPLLVRFPGRVRPGKLDDLVEATDLLPTLFDLAGIPAPRNCQGRSLAPLITDSARPYRSRKVVFCENIIPSVITAGDLDLQFEKGKGVAGIPHPDAKMVRSHKWKLCYYPGQGGELYDLENDAGEERNLYDDPHYRDVVQELKGKILDWMITADETEQIAEKWQF